jgi:hypothetical protein
MIYWKAILTPLYARRMKEGSYNEGWTPYVEVFIFGIRVLRWGTIS